MNSLLYELPGIVDEGKKEVEKILERLSGADKLALQTNEIVLPAKDFTGTENFWKGESQELKKGEWIAFSSSFNSSAASDEKS